MNVFKRQDRENGVIARSKNRFNDTKVKIAGIASAVALALPQMASAAAGDPGAVVKAAIDVVVKIFPFVGAFFVVAGIFKLILAYRNDQPESQTAAAKDIVIGAVFIAFATFVWPAFSGLIF